jgi:threonine dehydrogenase-like Zn-dependent dehydrogenase
MNGEKTMSNIINPTVGRIVWYRGLDGKTRDAVVAAVHGPFSLNLYVFGIDPMDHEQGYKTTVTHADPEIEPGCLPSWDWMPYQKGQAAKTEALQAQTEDPKTSGLTFGEAIDVMKRGGRVARAGWNGKNQWVCLGQGHKELEAEKFWNQNTRIFAEQNGGKAEVRPYMILKTADNAILMGWSPSQSDALAEDWTVVI